MVLKDTILNHRRGIMLLLISVSAILLLVLCAGSAAASDYSVAHGETVTLDIRNPFGGTAYLYIQGPNFPFTQLKDTSGDKITVSGRGRTVEIETSKFNGRSPDVGTYTIYVSNKDGATRVGNLDSGNGYLDSYSLTIRPIVITADIVSTSTQVPTLVTTQILVPTVVSTPMSTSTPVPASPAPVVAIIAALGAVILTRQRFN